MSKQVKLSKPNPAKKITKKMRRELDGVIERLLTFAIKNSEQAKA